jgi:hypothetical protein
MNSIDRLNKNSTNFLHADASSSNQESLVAEPCLEQMNTPTFYASLSEVSSSSMARMERYVKRRRISKKSPNYDFVNELELLYHRLPDFKAKIERLLGGKKIMAKLLELSLFNFIQELINILHTCKWEKRTDGVFVAELAEPEASVFAYKMSDIIDFIAQFNNVWSHSMTKSIHYQRRYFNANILDQLYVAQPKKIDSTHDNDFYFFQQYSIFHYVEKWHFEKFAISDDLAEIVWYKENTPIMPIDTVFNGLVFLLDNSTSPTHFKEKAKNIRALSVEIDEITNSFKDKKELKLGEIHKLIIKIKDLHLRISDLKVSFTKINTLLLNFLDIFFCSTLVSYSDTKYNDKYLKYQKIHTFLIWNTIIMGKIIDNSYEQDKINNSNIYKKELLSVISRRYGKKDYHLFNEVDNILCDLRNRLQNESITFDEFLIHFIAEESTLPHNITNKDEYISIKNNYYAIIIEQLKLIAIDISLTEDSPEKEQKKDAVNAVINIWNADLNNKQKSM